MLKKESQSNNSQAILFMVVIGLVTIVFLAIISSSSNDEDCTAGSCTADTESQGSTASSNDGYLGDTGITVTSEDGKIMLDESNVNDGDMHSFNYYSDTAGKNIYFFVLKASDGTYRVAANACEVCFGEKKGFKQVGDMIQCTNCGQEYTKDQIAMQKGGCNPGPISADAEVTDGSVEIAVSDVDAVAYLF